MIRLTQARARSGRDGIARVVAEVLVAESDVDAAAHAVRALGDAGPTGSALSPEDEGEGSEASDPPLAYPGLSSLEVRLTGGPVIRVAGQAELDPPGPIPARPGAGTKSDLDLSNLYTKDGLLGGDPIPDRVDVVLVPGAVGVANLPDLAGRLGLESAGFSVPLVEPSATLELPSSQPTMVLVGTENPFTDELVDRELVDLESLAPGEGLIEVVPDAFGSKSSFVVSGSDAAGASRALQQVALTFPNLSVRGKDRPTVDQVEQDLWDALAGYSPVGQAAIGMYKIDQIGQRLSETKIASARVPYVCGKSRRRAGPLPAESSVYRTRNRRHRGHYR